MYAVYMHNSRKTAMQLHNTEDFTKSKLQIIALHKRIKHQYVKGVVEVCLNMLGSSVVEYFRLESFKQDHTPVPADGAV